MRIYNNEDLAKFYEEEEGNLSPPIYESDEELRKLGINQHDYLIKLAETRKIILAQQLGKWHKNSGEKMIEEQKAAILASHKNEISNIKKSKNYSS